MYYLPLSVDAGKSVNQHQRISDDNLQWMVKNVLSAITYKGNDNPLTNWAKKNNMNMLHLVRFVLHAQRYYDVIRDNLPFLISNYTLQNLNAKNEGFTPTDTEDGKIAFTVNIVNSAERFRVVMDTDHVYTKRDDFIPTMPIPVSNNVYRDKFVWYSRLYYHMLSDGKHFHRSSYGGVTVRKYLSKESRLEFADNLFKLVHEMPELT